MIHSKRDKGGCEMNCKICRVKIIKGKQDLCLFCDCYVKEGFSENEIKEIIKKGDGLKCLI